MKSEFIIKPSHIRGSPVKRGHGQEKVEKSNKNSWSVKVEKPRQMPMVKHSILLVRYYERDLFLLCSTQKRDNEEMKLDRESSVHQ